MKKIFFLALLFTVNFCFAQVDLNLGLKAYYPFTGNANDVSGNNNNPVFNNATLTADRFGNPNSAYRFNGSSSYMQIPNSSSLNTNNKLSLTAWVKPMGFYSGPCHGNAVITKGNSGITPGLYAMWYDDNAGTNGANCSGPVNPAVENFYGIGCMTPPPGYTPYIQTNQWYSVTITYDGTTARLYINCQLKNTVSQGGLTFNNSDDLFIGKTFAAAFPYLVNGDIDEVRIYDRALNQDEVNVLGGCAVITEGCKGIIDLHGDDCVRLPLSQEYYANTGFTWETWFNSNWYENNDNTLRLGQSLIISEDAITCEDIQLGFGWQTIPRNAIGFVVDGAGTCASRDNNPVFYRPPAGFQPNTWYHVAGVRNYSTNQTLLYFNGQLVDTKSNTGLPFSRNILTRIGTYVIAGDSGFVGKMDEIRIWKTPRTAAQIQANYNKCLTGTETGLAAYYRANQNSGLTLINAVNNPSLNGTLDPTVAWNNTINAPLTNNCGLPITSTINITICRGLTYGGHPISGTYIDTFPAANGCDSIRTLNLTVLANIDSVRINNINSCFNIDFNGLAYTNTSPVVNWQWYFGDGGTANSQNTLHTYAGSGTYIVKLVVTDINGCTDSVTKTLTLSNFIADAGSDATICQASLPATVQLNASAGTTYAWTPAALLNNPSIQNPVATISTATRFYVTITNSQGCSSTDSVLISLASAPANTRYTTLTAIPYQNLQLQARNIGGTVFQWLPNVGLNNNTIANPVFYHSQKQEYTVRINTGTGCIVIDTQLVEIKGKKGIYVPRGFSPNGDGNNDRLYPILVGIKQLNYFKIYNRWGNLLFETTSGRPEDGWNGTFKGKKQPVETYTWVVEGVDIDNITIRKNGNTLLLQ